MDENSFHKKKERPMSAHSQFSQKTMIQIFDGHILDYQTDPGFMKCTINSYFDQPPQLNSFKSHEHLN